MARRRPTPDSGSPTPGSEPSSSPRTQRARFAALAAGALTAAGIIARVLLKPGTSAHRSARSAVNRARRSGRHAVGRLRGIEYRVSGKHPAPDVGDDILADRIRSTLGPIEKRLDIPRVHVTVFDHKAVLHGAIGNADEERAITEAVTSISGVSAVESRLHIGLSAGSTRPSVGRKPAARAGQHGRTA